MEAKEEIRKIFKLGGSLVFAIPRTYVDSHDIKAGDQIRIFYNDFIHAMPIEKEILFQKLEKAKMILDEHEEDDDRAHIEGLDKRTVYTSAIKEVS